jgi:hypothetical protein
MSGNSEQPIPAAWRKAVAKVLRCGDKARITSTIESRHDWESTFPESWWHDRPEAMAKALDIDGILGKHITDMVPPCDAYAFWFSYENRQLYGKIGLLPNGDVVIIFSSHVQRKGKKL